MHRQVENTSTPVTRLVIPRMNINLATTVSLNMPIIFYPSLHNDLSLHVGMDFTVVFETTVLVKGVAEGSIPGQVATVKHTLPAGYSVSY